VTSHLRGGAVVAIVVAGVLAAVAVTAASGVVRPDVALAFGLFIAFGELLQVLLPGDRLVAPIASAGALGYAMAFDVGGRPLDQGVAQVTTVIAAGLTLGWLVQGGLGRRVEPAVVARRLVAPVTAALLFRLATPDTLVRLDFVAFKQQLRWVALLMVAVVALAIVVDMVVGAVQHADGTRSAFGWVLRDEVGATSGLWAAAGATGILTALATPSMSLYALPTFCIPLLLTHFAFRRYAAIRTTYRQTIRSLSRVTEVGGYVGRGHADRVSAISVDVGRELGLTETEIADLEYAALLHDIGQLSLAEVIPGGSTLLVAPAERRRVAELGAEIIKTTGVLDRVAHIVARQADPYRRHRSAPDHTLPVQSRIIKAVSAYDDLVGAAGGSDAVADALERLRLGMAYEYDPRVVEALSRVTAPRVAVTNPVVGARPLAI
jgi:hypothetical protein